MKVSTEPVILKLGGSVITDKAADQGIVREADLLRIAKEVSEYRGKMIVVHGAGSFGHTYAKKYGLDMGFENYDIEIVKSYGKILVIEDASHMYEDTLSAMNKFCDVVTENSYLIVEDGIVDKLGVSKDFNGGPCKAIRIFLPQHPEFIVDRKWCDFFGKIATNIVNGYLKKIK